MISPTAPWRVSITCTHCGFAGYSALMIEGQPLNFTVPMRCPKCDKEKGPSSGPLPNRFTVWRETRRFRRQLRELGQDSHRSE